MAGRILLFSLFSLFIAVGCSDSISSISGAATPELPEGAILDEGTDLTSGGYREGDNPELDKLIADGVIPPPDEYGYWHLCHNPEKPSQHEIYTGPGAIIAHILQHGDHLAPCN